MKWNLQHLSLREQVVRRRMHALVGPSHKEETALTLVLYFGTISAMKLKHQRTLELIFARPSSGNLRWDDIVSLFRELGAEIKEREDSRVEVFLFGQVRVYHRPHPRPDADKGAVANVRRWLEQHGVTP